MTNQDLANFYGISTQAVGRWSPEKRKQKTVQALANAGQPMVDLIADISKLVFIFNCKWLHGAKQVKAQCINIDNNYIIVEGTEFWQSVSLHATDAVEQLQVIKTKMEKTVYGLQE